MLIWVSDDSNRLPVFFEAPLLVGTARGRMTGYEGLKYPFEALVEKKRVDEYLGRFQTAINHGKVDECIAIAREGVAEFPNNYELLNKLMYPSI